MKCTSEVEREKGARVLAVCIRLGGAMAVCMSPPTSDLVAYLRITFRCTSDMRIFVTHNSFITAK